MPCIRLPRPRRWFGIWHGIWHDGICHDGGTASGTTASVTTVARHPARRHEGHDGTNIPQAPGRHRSYKMGHRSYKMRMIRAARGARTDAAVAGAPPLPAAAVESAAAIAPHRCGGPRRHRRLGRADTEKPPKRFERAGRTRRLRPGRTGAGSRTAGPARATTRPSCERRPGPSGPPCPDAAHGDCVAAAGRGGRRAERGTQPRRGLRVGADPGYPPAVRPAPSESLRRRRAERTRIRDGPARSRPDSRRAPGEGPGTDSERAGR